MPTPIYHITHIANLESIVAARAIICAARRPRHVSIAYAGIQKTRASHAVPCGPQGVLHDYVPFYFAPRSPMLCAIYHGRVETYHDGQDSIIYLVTDVRSVIDVPRPFVFTDGHAIMALSNYYTDWPTHRYEIDWAVMKSRYWNDTQEHPDRKRRREAEFLVHESVPIEIITDIVVKNKTYAERVRTNLNTLGITIPIAIRPQWYF